MNDNHDRASELVGDYEQPWWYDDRVEGERILHLDDADVTPADWRAESQAGDDDDFGNSIPRVYMAPTFTKPGFLA